VTAARAASKIWMSSRVRFWLFRTLVNVAGMHHAIFNFDFREPLTNHLRSLV
jgi:hypothetical protein